VSADGKTLFINVAGGYGVADARVRQEVIVDVSDPASPVQLASTAVGASASHHGDALTGDGKLLFVANNIDGTVTQIDAATRNVVRTIKVKESPRTLATFGTAEGPSEQTGPIP
jgi:YVTN family beta-propeller protein